MPMAKNTNCHFNDRTISRENVRLIYFDTSPATSELQSRLTEISPATLFYTDAQLCTNVLTSTVDEEILVVLSNTTEADLLHAIHALPAIRAIFFIVIVDEPPTNEWRREYPKVVDVYASTDDLCHSLEEHKRWMEDQLFVYHLLDLRRQELSEQSAAFLWHRMLGNVLEQIPASDFKRDEALSKSAQYYRDNQAVLARLESLRQTYTNHDALRWFVENDFLRALVNRAFRTADIDFLYSLRFFILDLSVAIPQREPTVVYRAQPMLRAEIDTLQQHLGCLLSIDSFVFASRERNISQAGLRRQCAGRECVLVEMHIDHGGEHPMYADVSTWREQQVLLQINALFKVDAVTFNAEENLWEIKLISSNDGVKQINDYLSGAMQKEMDHPGALIYFGRLLWNDLGRLHQAKAYFQLLSKCLRKDHPDTTDIHAELGSIYDQLGEYNLALNKYQYAWNVRQKQAPNDHVRIALVLTDIGSVYRHLGNIDRAIDFYGQALYIYETKCTKNKQQLPRAKTIANLGLVYREKNDLDTALTYLTLAYDLRAECLPTNHPLLADSLDNIGHLYRDKKDYPQAMKHYQQALAIHDAVNPNDHLRKATTIRHIGLVHGDQQEWSAALTNVNRALEIRQRLLPTNNHADIAVCYGDLADLYEKTNQPNLALENYQRELQIEEQCLPFNHPNLMLHFDHIVHLLKTTDRSDKALELCQAKLARLKSQLGNDYAQHPRVARILVDIATIYEDRNPKQADQHYQEALAILESRKNDAVLQTCLSPMTNFYWKCRMFDRALICQMKLLNLRRSTLSSNHNDVAYALRGLARLYRAMDKPNEALHYFHQSLNILQANCGPEHADVKNIRQEIFDLKDMLHSTSAGTQEGEISESQVSDVTKSTTTPIALPSTALSLDRKVSSPRPLSKSVSCALL